MAYEGSDQTVRRFGGEPFGRDDGPAGHPAHGRDAGHPGGPIDEHGAAAALTLWATTVLYRTDSEVLSENVEQRRPVPRYLDGAAVKGEGDRQCSTADAAARIS
jgi:hypothetical protein